MHVGPFVGIEFFAVDEGIKATMTRQQVTGRCHVPGQRKVFHEPGKVSR